MAIYDPRIDDPKATLLEVLSADELEYFGYPGSGLSQMWQEIADFRANALDMYGLDWIYKVPTARECRLNGLIRYLWGQVLWGYQLTILYSPFASNLILGARGSGKTTAGGIIGATWTAFHPGNNWLHCGPSKDQVTKCQLVLLNDGIADPDHKRDFRHLFLIDHRTHPHPEVEFRKWDQYDPGSRAFFRTTGKPNEPGELLRSTECGALTFDEAFRAYDSMWAFQVVSGCQRGLNGWRANQKPEARDAWQEMAIDLDSCDDPDKREDMEIELDAYADRMGISKDTWSWIFGNAGFHGWPYRVQEQAQRGERPWYAATWRTKDNPAYTRRQREELIEKYADDPEQLAMEIEAKRPDPPGDIFTLHQIDRLMEEDMTAQVLAGTLKQKRGFDYKKSKNFGVIRYAMPASWDRVYVGGVDAGTQQIPARGKWVIVIADITERPFRIVYFEMGNLVKKDCGSMRPCLQRIADLLNPDYKHFYPMAPASLYADATGMQRDIYDVAATWSWEQPIELHGFNMQHKLPLISKFQILLSEGLFRMATVQQVEEELGNYTLPDNQPMKQDTVMAFLALSQAVWDFKGADLAELGITRQREEFETSKNRYRQYLAELAITNAQRLRTAHRELRLPRHR